MKISAYNQQGKEAETIILPKEIFEVLLSSDLVHQVAVSQMANQRKIIAHAKGRSEVRGGGRKPWRQKGTGRARHGSRRSPLWRGGGITFGPSKDRVFKKKINKNAKRKALFMVLSGKAKNNLLIVLDEIKIEKPKTKVAVKFLEKLPIKGSALLVLPKPDKNLFLATKNIPDFKLAEAKNLNVLDLLSFKHLILTKEAVKIIKETFLRKPKSQSANDKSISKSKKID